MTFCFVFAVNGQNDYRDGYILTHGHDTIFCKINFRGDIANSQKCVYLSNDGKESVFYPKDIYGYRFLNGKYYVSKYFKEKETTSSLFAEYLVQGQKDLYYFKDIKGQHFLIDYQGDSIIELPYNVTYSDEEGKNYINESKVHIGLLKAYFSDCPKLFSEIDRIGKPDFDNLTKLTKDYYHQTCGDSGCIIYYKPKTGFKLIVEPMIGAIKYEKTANYLIQYGVELYVWLPRANENLYLKTGFIYLPDTLKNNFSFRIPIQLEYLIPNPKVKFKIDFGFNYYYANADAVNYVNYHIISYDKDNWYYQNKALTVFLSCGALIRLSNNLYLDLNVGSDIINMSFKTSFMKSYSLNSGIYIKF